MVDGKNPGDVPASNDAGDPEDNNSDSVNTSTENGEDKNTSRSTINNSVQMGEDNTLWDQMTAREGRDDARRAGMRTGDWQAEMQLQEALRESRQEAGSIGVASAPAAPTNNNNNNNNNNDTEEERSFIDAGFHALATSAVEEDAEIGQEETAAAAAAGSPNRQRHRPARRGRDAFTTANFDDDKSAMMYSVDGAAAAAAAAAVVAGGDAATSGTPGSEIVFTGAPVADKSKDDDDGDEDEFDDDVELIVTQDGGIIPVAPATAAAAATTAATAVTGGGGATITGKVPGGEEKGGRKMARKGCKGGAGSGLGGVGDDAAAVRKARKSGGGKAGAMSGVEEQKQEGQHQQEKGEEEEEEEEEELPLPPDIVLTLPDDVLHRTMLFLHPEDILECRAVSSRWEFPGHEAVFEGLCRRTYLAQSAKKLLNVDRWRSWQRMFKFRPRLRDTGLYSLKTTYFKKPVRDMCTEWTPGKVLKVTYYRYFRFFGDGRVAYGLTHDSPKEFVRMLQEGSPKVVYGTYTISKWEVNVEIPNPWSWVNFTLQLANGERGRFTHLVMLRHSSVPRNDARVGRCNHKVKSSDFFTFRRVWQF